MAFPGLVRANNLSDVVDREKAWDNLGATFTANLVSDPDSVRYIAAVEAADGQSLEPDVKLAIGEFITGCKADGIWNAIKTSCILAGARTLNGALVPLVGTAPTNFNFVAGDYDRKTGLIGDGSTKYLNSNRNHNADPQNNFHMAAYHATPPVLGLELILIGIFAATANGNSRLSTFSTRNRNINTNGEFTEASGFTGMSRSQSSEYIRRNGGASQTIASTSQAPQSGNLTIYRSGTIGISAARIAFYSIGEALNLELLDARVTALINAIGAAIP